MRTPSNANTQTGLPSQLNWLRSSLRTSGRRFCVRAWGSGILKRLLNRLNASDANTPTVVEYPFYSDAHITDEFIDGLGPYSFLNTVPFPCSPGVVNAPIMLRAEIHLPQSLPDMSKTDESLYHGGSFVDELAALTSVALGIRIRAGEESRRFEPGRDPHGKPSDFRFEPKPTVHVQPNRPILPSVAIGQHPMSQLEIMKSIPRIKSDRYVNLIRACRSYQDALWIAESEPNLAWLMFVSALETAANDVHTTDASPEERLRDAKPDLAELLEKHGGDELVHKVAGSIVHTLGATKKFIDFTMQFMPDKPDQRPDHESRRVKWSESELKKILRKVYEYRSRALHDGKPFPAPMLRSPFYDSPDSPASEVPLTGIASHSLGGTWKPKDVPINLHCFHYITRGALLKWWEDMSEEESQ